MKKRDCLEYKRAFLIDYKGREICVKPSEKILNILGKRYTLLIIALLGNQERVKFNEMMKKTGCPRPNLLSMRLKELEKAGLIKRIPLLEKIPVSVEYELTKSGRELRKHILSILAWIADNTSFEN